ncbi:MAG: isopentenyl phosphate kinase [Candidatus Hodarchaeales archaeon]|jgi:isopentenyl phosphate kinase
MEIDLILKIGGSSISNKTLLAKALKSQLPDDVEEALMINKRNVDHIAAEIGELYSSGVKKMIILTGVGSPGHFVVLQHGIHKGNSGNINQHLGLVDAQIAVNRLRQALLKAFVENKIPVVQLYASSIFESNKMRIIRGDTSNFDRFIENGIVPVISGDVVPDLTMGYSVLSGDQILLDLVKKFSPRRIIFGSDVDGVFEEDPKVNLQANLITKIPRSHIDEVIDQVSTGDASGQMKGKLIEIRNLLDYGQKEIILLNITKQGRLLDAMTENSGPNSKFYVES